MDIWLVAVLASWTPVAVVLALLVGRTLADSEARERRAVARVHPRVDHHEALRRMRDEAAAGTILR